MYKDMTKRYNLYNHVFIIFVLTFTNNKLTEIISVKLCCVYFIYYTCIRPPFRVLHINDILI